MNQKYTLYLPYHASYTMDDIKTTYQHIASHLPIRNLILGFHGDMTYPKELIDYFHEFHIRVLLWMPVLANNPIPMDPMFDVEHHPQSHACPSSLKNAHAIIRLYETKFAALPFDGVFLDHMESASFASAYAQGFGCFCETCEKQMFSVDIPYIKDLIQRHDKNLLRGEYDKYGRYHFADYQVNMFYKRKAQIITDLVFKLAAYFNSRKLIVGVNVFAPIMAYHISQNINEIGKLVDFVQPMMFQKGFGSLMSEYDAYLNCFEDAHPFAKHSPEGLLSKESMRRQLDYLSNLNANVVPSLELQSDMDSISVTEVKEQLSLYSNYATIAFRGDLMQIDEEMLQMISALQLVA